MALRGCTWKTIQAEGDCHEGDPVQANRKLSPSMGLRDLESEGQAGKASLAYSFKKALSG